MTREEARIRAERVDLRIHEEITKSHLPAARKMLSEIRAYLIRRSEEMEANNNPIKLLKTSKEANGITLILLGPPIDKGATPEHFHFDSGARLSFTLSLREEGKQSELVSFRFHYQLPDGIAPSFIRFDLNRSMDADSLKEPRCHVHPGMESARIPTVLYTPIEILDQIFFVLEDHS